MRWSYNWIAVFFEHLLMEHHAMKHLLYILAALVVFVGTAPLAAENTSLRLTTAASLPVMQDRLAMSLQVYEEGKSAEQVQEAINRRMERAVEKAKTQKGVEVKTGHYRVYYRDYHRNEKAPDQAKGRWVGSQTLIIDSGAFDALKALAGSLQQQGLVMNHMNFYVSAGLREETKNKLIPLAVSTLKEKAKLYQAALGGEALTLTSIEVQGAHQGRFESAPMMKSAMADTAAAPVVGEPDEQEISLSLMAAFTLKPVLIQ